MNLVFEITIRILLQKLNHYRVGSGSSRARPVCLSENRQGEVDYMVDGERCLEVLRQIQC